MKCAGDLAANFSCLDSFNTRCSAKLMWKNFDYIILGIMDFQEAIMAKICWFVQVKIAHASNSD